MNDKIPSFVLNDFLTFERKIYQIGEHPLPRAISLKSMGYFVGAAFVLFVMLQLPLIGWVMGVLPTPFWLIVAVGISWLLGEYGTENRLPVNAFQSMCRYHWLKWKKESYYNGKIMIEQEAIQFRELPAVNVIEREPEVEEVEILLTYKPIKANERGAQNGITHRVSSEID